MKQGGLEWDDTKAAANLRKHGVTFQEAVTALRDPLSQVVTDPDNSGIEVRWITRGLSNKRRLLVVSTTERDGNIRIISARPATTSERKSYEETIR